MRNEKPKKRRRRNSAGQYMGHGMIRPEANKIVPPNKNNDFQNWFNYVYGNSEPDPNYEGNYKYDENE